ncbi:MAG: TRAP transporter TatT component family protein [Gammaproteobacteria bacterium]|nr:TRAP transporter TatT component family protein [Gammaproteobacteria bacterium]
MLMQTSHYKRLFAPLRVTGLLVSMTLLTACSMGQIVVRSSQAILDSGIEAMNRETDLQLARAAIPANIKLVEGMLIEDPGNTVLRLYAAEGFYGYSYGFIEDEDRARASLLYRRCYEHARLALQQAGMSLDPERTGTEQLANAVARLDSRAVPALFWTASCLGKWIDLNRDNVRSIAGFGNAAALMQGVIEHDDDYYHGGAHMFFGVYYGARAPMLGGDFARSQQHFARAHEINGQKLLLVDLLKAEYLYRQQLDRKAFHDTLQKVRNAPDDLYPEMALVNTIARRKAHELLAHEDDWF